MRRIRLLVRGAVRLADGKTRELATVAWIRRGFGVAVADAFPIGNVAVELAVSTVRRGGCRSRVARRVTIIGSAPTIRSFWAFLRFFATRHVTHLRIKRNPPPRGAHPTARRDVRHTRHPSSARTGVGARNDPSSRRLAWFHPARTGLSRERRR